MSYETQSTLPKATQLAAVYSFMALLGYDRYKGAHPFRRKGVVDFGWVSHKDFESTTGIAASVGVDESGCPYVYTRTPAGRSIFDLRHQNRTVRELRARFGGNFLSDSGRNRCMGTEGMVLHPPAARGVLRAYSRFQFSLAQIAIVRSSMIRPTAGRKISGIDWLDSVNPIVLSNNLLLPFLTAGLEDYFKSMFIALLRYSDRREAFFKNARLSAGNLARISEGELSVEEGVAESLPFQRLSSICDHFKSLDSGIDLAGCFKRPYRKRKVSLLESIDGMVERRHRLIHQNSLVLDYSDRDVDVDVHNLAVTADRAIQRLNAHFKWSFSKYDLMT